MDPMTIALLASAGLGVLKAKQDQDAYKQNMKVQAVKERWSPFTGRAGQMPTQPSSMNTMMQSLLAGAMFGQQFGKGKPETVVEADQGSQNIASASLTQDDPETMRRKLRQALGEPGGNVNG